jgi:hypothetical protein
MSYMPELDLEFMSVDVGTLRQLLKGLQNWRAANEDYGVCVIPDPSLREWHILDVEMIYRASQTLLAKRQAQAIKYHLVHNMREEDVARLMGIAPTNPVGMYATDGLKHLVSMIEDGLLP